MMLSQRDQLVEWLYRNRVLAHQYIFPARRKNKSPEAHAEVLRLLYSPAPYALVKAFRGFAKSTLVEEYTLLSVLFKDFKFPIIVGNSYDRSCERLAAIKNEIDNNEVLNELFGDQHGAVWSANEIILACGAKIQAFGAKQSLRGAKHMDDRPDLAVVDDLEDEDMVGTEQARRKLQRWFNGGLLPALVPWGKVRMVGTPLHPKSLLEEKIKDARWASVIVPAVVISPETGLEESAWPDRFSMEHLAGIRNNYVLSGSLLEWEQEYQCRSEDVANKPFQADMITHGVMPAGYYPTEIMVDPARTTNKNSARTGYAVFTWVGTKLYVREAFGAFHKPDEIIKTIFELNEKYSPCTIGVEADGLEEFLMQPLRTAQVERGVAVPLRAMRAPRDKQSFITSLQPFYRAGGVVHVGKCQDLEAELLAFPTGRVDVPNALAYALKMRAGQLVYENFGADHIVETLDVDKKGVRYLAVNSSPACTAAVLMQYKDGNIKVIKDWVMSSPPQEALPLIIPEVTLLAGDFTAVCPQEQTDRFTNNGVPAALRGRKPPLLRVSAIAPSIGCLTARLNTKNKGLQAFQVSQEARWTVNAMARGYARRMDKSGSYSDYPEQNQHSLVVEAIETFASYLGKGMLAVDEGLVMAQTSNGRRYITSSPHGRD